MVAVLKPIFVFGSNLAGRHGKGAALEALEKHGAVYGQGIGLQGCSYGIPTKDESLQTLPLNDIRDYVDEFIELASLRPDLQFNVTRIGCGLAGYTDAQIAPMFKDAPDNCELPYCWRDYNIPCDGSRHRQGTMCFPCLTRAKFDSPS